MRKYIIIIALLFVAPCLYSQILYNIEMPKSSGNEKISSTADLPAIEFETNEAGRINNKAVNTDFAKTMRIEKTDECSIGRIKISVNTENLGFLDIRLKDVKLRNGACCYIYTADYKVVAGPIFEKSITERINIVHIPAKEMIIEVCHQKPGDFDFVLESVSFEPVHASKKAGKNQLQQTRDGFCDACTEGEKNFFDDFGLDCESFGASDEHKDISEPGDPPVYVNYSDVEALFGFDSFNSVNDLEDEKCREVSRAACMIIGPEDNSTRGKPGTLINLPGEACGEGTIIATNHTGLIVGLEDAATNKWDYDSYDQEQRDEFQAILDNVIVRFNWHYKYGTPYYLEGKSCEANFELWRETIDFDEVIDYCGVEVLKSTVNREAIPDAAILKMQQKPFYKELHLGWSTQSFFEYEAASNNGSEYTEKVNNPNDYMIIGRRASLPTTAIKPFEVGASSMSRGIAVFKTLYRDFDDPNDSYYCRGWSGSQLLYSSTCSVIDDKILGLGIVNGGRQDRDFVTCQLYKWFFADGSGTNYGIWNFYDHGTETILQRKYFEGDFLVNYPTFYNTTDECHDSQY